jgi:prevent-host-death family protein
VIAVRAHVDGRARRDIVIYMVMRHGLGRSTPRASVSAAEFKAKCLELMDIIEQTGRSVVVTKRGRPVAVLGPVRVPRGSAFGYMKGSIKILGDIQAPIDLDWDAER